MLDNNNLGNPNKTDQVTISSQDTRNENKDDKGTWWKKCNRKIASWVNKWYFKIILVLAITLIPNIMGIVSISIYFAGAKPTAALICGTILIALSSILITIFACVLLHVCKSNRECPKQELEQTFQDFIMHSCKNSNN